MAGLPQAGQMFGRYELLRIIGRGGMGTVFAARQTDLGRTVALKVLSSDLAADEEYRRRFLQEAAILGRIDSPEVIHVYETGEHDGWLYIATQYVDGGDLQAWLRTRGPLSASAALDLVAQITSGLKDAHELGILHRDIKPSNVLLRERENELRGFLCDLGISRLVDSEHTRTTGVIGTLGYMAPERHEGSEATAASDIYAVGCLLWAAVSGGPPYEGTDLSVALAHLNQPIPQLDPSVAGAVEINRVLATAMAKNPSDRYADAGAMMVAMRSALTAVRSAEASHAPTSVDPIPSEGPTESDPELTRRRGSMVPPPPPSEDREAVLPHEPTPPAAPVPSPEPAEPARAGRRVRRTGILAGALVLVLALAGTAIAMTGGDETKDDSPGSTANPAPTTPTTSPTSTPTLTAAQRKARTERRLRTTTGVYTFGAGGLGGARRALDAARKAGWTIEAPAQGWADDGASSRIYYGRGLLPAARLLGKDLGIGDLRTATSGTSEELTLVVAEDFGTTARDRGASTSTQTSTQAPTQTPAPKSTTVAKPRTPSPTPRTPASNPRIEVRHASAKTPCPAADCTYVQIRLLGFSPRTAWTCYADKAGAVDWTVDITTRADGSTGWLGGSDLYDSDGNRFRDGINTGEFGCGTLGPAPMGRFLQGSADSLRVDGRPHRRLERG